MKTAVRRFVPAALFRGPLRAGLKPEFESRSSLVSAGKMKFDTLRAAAVAAADGSVGGGGSGEL